jgi:hypothetical protein
MRTVNINDVEGMLDGLINDGAQIAYVYDISGTEHSRLYKHTEVGYADFQLVQDENCCAFCRESLDENKYCDECEVKFVEE